MEVLGGGLGSAGRVRLAGVARLRVAGSLSLRWKLRRGGAAPKQRLGDGGRDREGLSSRRRHGRHDMAERTMGGGSHAGTGCGMGRMLCGVRGMMTVSGKGAAGMRRPSIRGCVCREERAWRVGGSRWCSAQQTRQRGAWSGLRDLAGCAEWKGAGGNVVTRRQDSRRARSIPRQQGCG